jgi:hypothetical protein
VAGALTASDRVTNDARVLSPFHQPRAIISALLLLVQVLGLAHVALDRHTVSGTGAIVDVVPLATETHEADEDHLCAGDLAIHAEAPRECLVIAVWSSPSVVTEPVALSSTAQLTPSGIPSASSAAPQFDALTRAPKASPPQS